MELPFSFGCPRGACEAIFGVGPAYPDSSAAHQAYVRLAIHSLQQSTRQGPFFFIVQTLSTVASRHVTAPNGLGGAWQVRDLAER